MPIHNLRLEFTHIREKVSKSLAANLGKHGELIRKVAVQSGVCVAKLFSNGSKRDGLLGKLAPAGLAGIHLNFVIYQPTEEEMQSADAEEQAMMASSRNYQQHLSAYAQLQSTRPQAISYALSDSPLGQAAWIYSLIEDVADCNGDPSSVFSMDEILDDIMLYWLPNASAPSARLYWEAASAMMSGPPPFYPSTMPTGISMFPKEQVRISKRWAEARFKKLMYYKQCSSGGHFAALEQPNEFVEGVRSTFVDLRP